MRQILILLLWLITFNASAEEQYKIFSVTGDVYVIKGKDRVRAARRMTVSADTEIDIMPESVIKLLAAPSGRVYSSKKEGVSTISKIVSSESYLAENTVFKANRKILEATGAATGGKEPRFRTGGVSMHSADAANADSLSLTELLASTDRSDQTDVVLLRREHNPVDSTFNFVVFNTLDYPVYVNIVNSPDYPVECLFPQNVVVRPRGETDINQYMFSLLDCGDRFALISSREDFSRSDVEKLVRTPIPGFHLSIYIVPSYAGQ